MASRLSIKCPVCGSEPFIRCNKVGPLPHKQRLELERTSNLADIIEAKPVNVPASGKGMVLTFIHEKTTPGAYRYKELDSNGVIAKQFVVGSIYLRKDVIGSKPPQKITVTIDSID